MAIFVCARALRRANPITPVRSCPAASPRPAHPRPPLTQRKTIHRLRAKIVVKENVSVGFGKDYSVADSLKI
jgi:hypothetical protein